jgi:hypothetical protein
MTEDDDGDTRGMMIIRRREGDENFIGDLNADTHTLYTRLELFVTEGVTAEILGYYPRTTCPSERNDIYYDTREAEEIFRD